MARQSICHGYIYIVLYVYRSAKFGVAVLKASMLNWPGGQSTMGICGIVLSLSLYIYIDLASLV